jgi:hypothetical protein
VLGLFARPVVFILGSDMAVAYFIAHSPTGFFRLLNAGELAIIYCFVFLYLAVAGGGVWSLDHLRAGSIAGSVAYFRPVAGVNPGAWLAHPSHGQSSKREAPRRNFHPLPPRQRGRGMHRI